MIERRVIRIPGVPRFHVLHLSILALFLRSYFVPFPFTYRILLSHEIDGVRKEKERLTASMSHPPVSSVVCPVGTLLHSSLLARRARRKERQRAGRDMETEGPFMKRDVKGSGSDEGTERAQPLFPCLHRSSHSFPISSRRDRYGSEE